MLGIVPALPPERVGAVSRPNRCGRSERAVQSTPGQAAMPFALHSPTSEAGSKMAPTHASAAVATADHRSSIALRTMGGHVRVVGALLACLAGPLWAGAADLSARAASPAGGEGQGFVDVTGALGLRYPVRSGGGEEGADTGGRQLEGGGSRACRHRQRRIARALRRSWRWRERPAVSP